MYAYNITEALPASTPVKANILPALDVSGVCHWYEPSGVTRTGQVESLELIDGIWWAAARYRLVNTWVLENRFARHMFSGPGPEFALQIGQTVFIAKRGGYQSAVVTDLYLESNVWMVCLEWREWYGMARDEKPVDQVFTTAPNVEEEYSDSKAEFWADYRYEDVRDSR